MTEKFWLDKNCPICSQGRLFIIEDLTEKKLYLHCEECECGWNTPEELKSENSFLAIYKSNIEFASKEKIEKSGWSNYSLKSFKE